MLLNGIGIHNNVYQQLVYASDIFVSGLMLSKDRKPIGALCYEF